MTTSVCRQVSNHCFDVKFSFSVLGVCSHLFVGHLPLFILVVVVVAVVVAADDVAVVVVAVVVLFCFEAALSESVGWSTTRATRP